MKHVIRFLVLALLAGLAVWGYQTRVHRETRVVEATREKILLLGNGTELETLDPHIATGDPERKVTTAIFEGLVAVHQTDDYGDAPGAAASWEQVDFTTWKFHLQPEGRWSDGLPVTAQDFVYSYQRMLTPELASQYAEMLYFLKNAEAFNRGELKDFSQVGVKALDDHTLELTLKGPVPYFTSVLKHHSWYPLPRHVIEKNGGMTDRFSKWARAENIVGNGPFMLKEWHFMSILKAARNPFYWDRDKVKLKEIHYFPITNEGTEERSFRNGQLHATMTMPLDRIPFYREHHKESYREETQLAVYYYRLNISRPPLNDVRVRKALSLAVDQRSIIRNVLRGAQRPAIGYTPTSGKGYDGVNVVHFDPVEAKRLLAEAGFPDGKGFPRFEILINTMEGHRLIAQAVQSMWKQHLGIDVGIINQDWQVYLDTQKRIAYDMSRSAWVGDYMDPMTFLDMWTTGHGNNMTGWGNPRYDELIRESGHTGDVDHRFAILKEAETILLNEMPIIPVYWYARSMLVRPQVKGWRSSLLDDRPYKWMDLQENLSSH